MIGLASLRLATRIESAWLQRIGRFIKGVARKFGSHFVAQDVSGLKANSER